MIGRFISLYSKSYPLTLVYMLQNTEYNSRQYLSWFWRTADFRKVMYRRQLDYTKPVRLLLLYARVGIALHILLAIVIVWWGVSQASFGLIYGGLALLVAYPFIWAVLLIVPLWLGVLLIVGPQQRKLIKQSEKIFANHPGHKIAIAGSYGKTSMKELLVSVMGASLKVAATPANKNVAISHAYFANKLQGDEDVVILEYGEGKPGDIAAFARVTHPSMAVITGLAPAHLDQYASLDDAAKDIFSVASFVDPESVYVSSESAAIGDYLKGQHFQLYNRQGGLGWSVSNVKVDFSGTSFVVTKGAVKFRIKSGLLGRHNIGPLLLAIGLAFQFGMKPEAIVDAVANTKPYEHRMQPYRLSGAWVIDDTYNGNIEGIKAGTELLAELRGSRKIYVTPGLVDQGEESQSIHQEVGRLIALSKPDVVILIKNSVTEFIRAGLESAGYSGEVRTESDPLKFYTNLDQVIAAGDVVMMQNDWPDNYS